MILNLEILREAYRELIPGGNYPVRVHPWERAHYIKDVKLQSGYKLLLFMGDHQHYSNGMLRKAIGSAWNQRKNELNRKGIRIEMTSNFVERATGRNWYRLMTPLDEIDIPTLTLKNPEKAQAPLPPAPLPPEAMISKAMLGHIHKIRRLLELDDDEYRDMLERYTGYRSAKNLSWDEARALIRRLHFDYKHLNERQF